MNRKKPHVTLFKLGYNKLATKMADSTSFLMKFLKESRREDQLQKRKRRSSEKRNDASQKKRQSHDLKFENWKKMLILMLKEMSGPQQTGVASSLAAKKEAHKINSKSNHTFTWWIKMFEEVVG